MAIVIEHLDYSYGRLGVLRNVSACARPCRITAVIGPNAAGKSTLLRCIIGAIKPQAGRVLVDGVTVHSQPPRRLAQRIAYVPQRPVVSAAFSVRQVVELGRYALAANPARVDQAISRLDLVEVADRPYRALSVGQQQRVSLARACAQLAPDGYLVLDEPTSAMDLRHVSDCMRLLRDLAGFGATVLMAVHDLSLAAAIADEIWLLDDGRMVASGEVDEVMNVDSLSEVFGVGFERVDLTDGRPRLLANLLTGQRGTITA